MDAALAEAWVGLNSAWEAEIRELVSGDPAAGPPANPPGRPPAPGRAGPRATPRALPTASQQPGSLRILHLSDFHLRPRSSPTQSALLREALDVIRGLVEQGRGPQLVALTGDLANKAKPEEYALVHSWLVEQLLPAVGLGPEQLVVIPGNHDVDWGIAAQGLPGMVGPGLWKDRQRVDEVLADPATCAAFDERYAAYLGFLDRLGVAHPHTPGWSWRTRLGGHPLYLVGLDTAWLHVDDGLQGRLVLGRRRVDQLLADRQEGDLIIALSHHPLDWLTEWDQRDVRPPLRKHVHVHLHGHLHQADPRFTRGARYGIATLPAGAMYHTHRYANSFQLLELSPAAHQLRARVFVWVPEEEHWLPDRTRFPPDGLWEDKLR